MLKITVVKNELTVIKLTKLIYKIQACTHINLAIIKSDFLECISLYLAPENQTSFY